MPAYNAIPCITVVPAHRMKKGWQEKAVKKQLEKKAGTSMKDFVKDVKMKGA